MENALIYYTILLLMTHMSTHLKSLIFLGLLIGSAFCQEFDFVVLGIGTAGAVTAYELSNDPSSKVAVIDWGVDRSDIFSYLVAFINSPWLIYGNNSNKINRITTQNFYVDHVFSQESAAWSYRSIEHQIPKVFGGMSSMNGEAYGRFTEFDLSRFNNSFWTYEAILNDIKKIERCVGDNYTCNPAYHGTSGPIVTNTFTRNSVLQQITDVMTQVFGIPYNPDLNGPSNVGVGALVRNLEDVNGLPVRQDSYSKFLKPVLSRPNLYLIPNARVLKVIPKKNGKGSVLYQKDDTVNSIKAKKEIILALGNNNDAYTLLHSGIGPCEELVPLGISCVVNNSHVGKNFQDSLLTSMVFGTFTAPTTGTTTAKRQMATNTHVRTEAECELLESFGYSCPEGSDVYSVMPETQVKARSLTQETQQTSTIPGAITAAFYASPGFTDGPNMEAAVSPVSGPPVFPTTPQLYFWQVSQLYHEGVGRLTLESDNNNVGPLFTMNFTTNMSALVDQVKKIRQTMAAANIGAFELRPGYTTLPLNATDDQIATYLRGVVVAEGHTVGTCSLNKVVDGRNRLIDNDKNVIPGIRVCSNSIIPVKPRSHGTSSGAMIIGMVCARHVKEDWNIPN